MPDAPFAVEEADAASTNPLLMAHQLAMDLLFLTGLRLSLALDARVAVQHAETTSFAAGRANEPVVRHAAVLLIAGCDRVPIAKSLPNFQRQGRCLMHL